MRLIPTLCVFALAASPALARGHLASPEPLGLMHAPPAASTPTPISPETTAVLGEIERKADLARIKSDAFDRRIQEADERAMRSICTGCLSAQPKAAHVRVRLATPDTGADQAEPTATSKPINMGSRRHVAMVAR